jgi:SLT domain-containing protein
MRDAAQAKAALQGMQDAVKSETAAEVAGATQAAAARQKDLIAIREEAQALTQLGNAAKQTNVQLLYGGRSNEQQHLSDMAQELQYTTLLNRQRWLGFSSVQQAMSYRQQMYQLALLENKAHFAGYLTADQYLGFLQRETMQTAALSAAIRDRTGVISAETSALLAHANTLQGTNQSLGSLGEQLGTASVYAAALSGVSPLVRTRAEFDDSQALVQLAAYRAALAGIPQAESVDIITSATRLGGVPLLPRAPAAEYAPGTLDKLYAAGQYAEAWKGLGEAVAGLEGEERALAAREYMVRLSQQAAGDLASGAAAAQIGAIREEAEALEEVLTGLVWERPIEIPLEIEGGDEAAVDLAAIRATLDAIPDDVHKVIYVDDVEAVDEMEAFTRLFESIPDSETTQLELDAAPAREELDDFAQLIMEAARKKYEFEAGFDDTGALDDLDVLEGKIVDIGDEAKAAQFLLDVLAAKGGAGGGGGGPPLPPVMPSGFPDEPDPDDAAIWDSIERAMRGADNEAVRSAGTSRAAGKAAADAGNAARGAGGWWGFWTRDLTLFGGAFAGIPFVSTISVWALALHTLLDFFIVLVPAVIAAGVALGTFAVALQPAAQDIYNRFEGLHIALDALTTGDSSISQAAQHIGFLSDQMGTLNAVMKPVPVTFRTLQDSMAPEGVTLYGAAINTLAHGTGLLGTIVQRTGAWVETFAIKLQTALTSESGVLGPLVQTALNDLHILGSIGGSILQIFTELLRAGEITHVSELLFEGIAYALSVVAKALQLIGPDALAAGIAFFAVVHYGGLLVTALRAVVLWVSATGIDLVVLGSRLPLVGGAFAAFGLDARAALAALSPAVFLAVAAAIAAVGFAIYSAAQASNQAKTYVGGLQAVLASDTAAQGFAQIQTNLQSTSKYLATAAAGSRNFVGNMAQGWSDLFKAAPGLARYKDLWMAITGTNQQPGSTALVLKEQTAEQKDWTTSLQAAAWATRQYGTTAQESFALMDLAGVKVADTLAVQQTKVADLVTGWLNMGVQGYQLKNGMNQLGAAINAVSLAADISDSSITALTGDFTAFVGLATGGQTAFETYAQGILTVRTNWLAAHKAGEDFNGVAAASLTLRSSWEANLTAGQALYNNLLLQNAAAGNTARTNRELASAGRDVVSTLLAQGGASQESVQGAYALAQTMGYTGAATYAALVKWSGGNRDVTKTTEDLNTQVGLLQGQSSNLQTDVLNLSAAIGTNLNTAIAQGLVNMPALTKAVSGFYQYVLTHREAVAAGPTAQEISLADSVANALVAVYGTTPQGLDQAKNEFLATLSQTGVARSQAITLWEHDRSASALTIKPTLDITGLQHRLTEMNGDISRAYVPAPGFLAQSDANQKKIVTWFADTMPHAAAVGWSAVYNGFDNDVWHPIGDFLNKDLPNWYNNSNAVLLSGWQVFARWWDNNISGPWDQFWNHTVEGWAAAAGTFITGVWANVAHGFGQYLVSDVSKFFTVQMPDWLDGLGRDWNRFWSTGWSDFNKLLVQPMLHVFTTTMPNAIWGGLKGGIDRAVGGMNTVIGFINDVTGVVGVHIGKIPSLAAGGWVPMSSGSVPGTGDEDGTRIIAMGGEYMLRKPARMALQAKYGPDFLDHLNQADSWLGSGSRGSLASQQGPSGGRYASGGGVLSGIENWLGSSVGDVADLAKAAWHGAAGAAGEVAKFGEQAVFNAMWGLSGKPAETNLEHTGTPGAMGAAWLQDIHNGVETWISGKTSTAQKQATASVPFSASAGVTQWEGVASRALALLGQPAGDLVTVVSQMQTESGGNPTIVNKWDSNWQAGHPSVGLMQVIAGTFDAYADQFRNTGPFEYGVSVNPLANVFSGLNYAVHAYPDWTQVLGHGHGYAPGGPVISAIRDATASREQQESMALGSWLLSKWAYADADRKRDEYGAFLVDVRKHKGFTAKDAIDPAKAARLMEPYYRKGVDASTAARWKSRPDQAALYASAIAETAAGTHWTTPSEGTVQAGWKEVTAAFRGIPEKQVSTLNTADVAEWGKLAPKIRPEWAAAFGNWQHLYDWDKRPDARPGASSRAWSEWLAERGAGEHDERLAAAAMAPILGHLRNPKLVASTAWGKAHRALGSWATEMDEASLAKKYHPQFWKSAVNDVVDLEAQLTLAQHSKKYNPKIEPTWKGATSNWADLYAFDKRPEGLKKPTAKAWDAWLAERATIAKQEKAANAALSPIFASVGSPQQLLAGNWPAAETGVLRFADALGTASLAREFHPGYFTGAEKDLSVLGADLKGAQRAWQGIWGEYLVPGIQVRQPGSQPITVDLDKLILGAPFGAGGSGGGGYGFNIASGGAVPGLADVAGMFGGGMAAGGITPDLFVPGMSASLQSQLQAQAVNENPRTLSEAAGNRGGLHVGSLTINNPKAEKPSDSITRSSNRLAFMAGRGPV